MPPTDEATPAPPDLAADSPRGDEAATSPVPSPDPSDPDGAMYAALRARPDWTEKPAVKAAIEELARDVPPGQDLFYWPVAKPGEIKESDAREHVAIAAGEVAQLVGSTGLESRRVYVAPSADARQLATVRSPGRNGPAQLAMDSPWIMGLPGVRPPVAAATSGVRPPVAAATSGARPPAASARAASAGGRSPDAARAGDPKAAAIAALETTLLSSPSAVRRSPGSRSAARWTWLRRIGATAAALLVLGLGLWRMGRSTEPSMTATTTASTTAASGRSGARAEAFPTGRVSDVAPPAAGAATSPLGVTSSPTITSASSAAPVRTAATMASAPRTSAPRIVAAPPSSAAPSPAVPVASSIEVDTAPPVASSSVPGPPAPTWTREPPKPGPRVPEARPEF